MPQSIRRSQIVRYQFHRMECPNESTCRCWQRCQSPDAKRPPRWATVIDHEAVTVFCLDWKETTDAEKAADEGQAQEATADCAE